jgi:flagellar basal body-associated protein FliL
MKTTIALLICFLASFATFASDSTSVTTAKTTIYVSLAGKGNSRSINAERIFRTGAKMNYSYSVGVSLFNKNISVPVSVNAITAGSKHHFEMSVAVIPYVEKHEYVKTNKVDSDKQLYIKPSIGYRYQKAEGGLFVKVGVGPQVFLDPPSYNVFDCTAKVIAPSGHLAIGFSF